MNSSSTSNNWSNTKTTNETVHAITSYKVDVTFNANGATISKTSDSCTYYNQNKSCNITSPTITRSGYTAVGWNTNNMDTTNAWSGWSVSTQEVEKAFTTTGEIWYAITNEDNTSSYLRNLILTHNVLKTGADFTIVADTEEQTGLFSAPDDYGTSYYFRGGVTNNNVIFAGYQWKIIRIDGNGNIRLLYNGLCPVNNCSINPPNSADVLIGSSQFGGEGSGFHRAPSYVFRSDSTDSTIKIFVDDWYNTNFSDSNKNKVVNVIYCNDITQSDYETGDEWTPYVYEGWHRINEKRPSLQCTETNQLTLSIALITSDEILMSGPRGASYIGQTLTFSTMTPSYVEKVSSCGSTQGKVYSYSASGFLSHYLDNDLGVRPVLSLRPETIVTGDGTSLNPYVVQ